MNRLIFYTTVGCHLCEHAALLLDEFAALDNDAMQYELEEVDISTDERLVALYGVRIPVVRNETTEKEVGWPFELTDIARLF